MYEMIIINFTYSSEDEEECVFSVHDCANLFVYICVCFSRSQKPEKTASVGLDEAPTTVEALLYQNVAFFVYYFLQQT